MKTLQLKLLILMLGLISTSIQAKGLFPQNKSEVGESRGLFSENKGQITGKDSDKVKFIYEVNGLKIFILKTGIAYQFTQMEANLTQNKQDRAHYLPYASTEYERTKMSTYRMDLHFEGANTNAKITTSGKSDDYINYYNHNVLDVHSYQKITFHDFYPGIDWVLYCSGNQLKYDFIVHPGADPSLICIKTNWVEDLTLNEDGSLKIENRLGSITEQKPVSFQGNQKIETEFFIGQFGIVFKLGNYDRTKELIIDPVLQWSTYYGGSENDWIINTRTDNAGNVYECGTTLSSNAIAIGGFQSTYSGNEDAFLVKFNSSGVRIWATYYGGAEFDYGDGLTIDPLGNIYMCGPTNSTSNISWNGHQNTFGGFDSQSLFQGDAYLVKFDPAGTRLWATYYGGTDGECAYDLDTDDAGNLFMSGNTSSNNAIASPGSYQDAYNSGQPTLTNLFNDFLVKFDPNGVRLWGTYFGGTYDPPAMLTGVFCSVDNLGNIYMSSTTHSTSGISTPGAHQTSLNGPQYDYDSYLVKFDPLGTRIWGTYYGGESYEFYGNCQTDNAGNVYLCGETWGSITNIASIGAHQDVYSGGNEGFLVKFNSSGVREWATYYGGTNDEGKGFDCSIDTDGIIYLTGFTNSTNNISTIGSYQESNSGGNDIFIAAFNPAGNRLWGTYYGGIEDDLSFGSTVDNLGALYVSGISKSLTNIAFMGHQSTFGGGTGYGDGVLIKFAVESPDCMGVTIDVTVASQTNILCNGGTDGSISISASGGTSPYSYSWSNSGPDAPIQNNLSAGSYTTVVYDDMGCFGTVSVSLTEPDPIELNESLSNIVCGSSNGSITLAPTGGISPYTYAWSPSGETSSTISDLTAGNYSVTLSDQNGCMLTGTFPITLIGSLIVDVNPSVSIVEAGTSVVLTATGGTNYTWSPASGLSCTDCASPTANPSETTLYMVTTTEANGCTGSAQASIIINTNCGDVYIPTIFTPDDKSNQENSFMCVYGNCISNLEFAIYNRWGEKVFETSDPAICWDGSYKGAPLNAGVFAYKLNVTDLNGNSTQTSGNITLVR